MKQEVSFLGRSLRYGAEGIEWEGDRKLVQPFLERDGIDEATEVGAVDTPGIKHDPVDDSPLMSAAAATAHRGLCALLNSISQDRGDIGFAAKHLSQSMARPRECDQQGIKRAARYLRLYPRAFLLYAWQSQPSGVVVYTDADWGGCVKMRRSTSGGVVLYGSHCLGFWSRTQQTIALSSCESEVNSLIKGGGEGIGVKHLVQQCGVECTLELRTDAAAACGLCARQGAGKVKHLTVRQLWAQEKVAAGVFRITKVPRLDNHSDLLTHHWTASEGSRYMPMISLQRLEASTGIKSRRRLEISGQ